MVGERLYGAKIGYILPGLARAHKIDLDKLSSSTWYYLTASMDGLTTDDILCEMLQRRIGSAQVKHILEKTDPKFHLYDVRTQTTAISSVLNAQDAASIEEICGNAMVLRREIEADKKELMKVIAIDPQRAAEIIAQTLNAYESGEASGKHKGIICLRTMQEMGCDRLNRYTCVGCGNDIYTSQMMRTLLQDVNDLKLRMLNEPEELQQRALKLIQTRYLPTIRLVAKIIVESGGSIEEYGKLRIGGTQDGKSLQGNN